MGRIAIPRHKFGPPAKAGVARPPWPGYMTRERRAMAGFGESMFSLGRMLGQKVTNQLVQSEFAEGKAALQRSDNEFFQNAVDDPDYDKLAEKYSKESKKWQEEIVSRYKTPGARNALKNMITADAPRMNDTLNGIIKGKAQEDARIKVLESIQGTTDDKTSEFKPGFIPRAGATPDELELGIINATSTMQGAVESGLYSKNEGEEIIIYALMEDWPEVALEQIDASSLLPQRKLQLKSQAKGTMAQKQREQATQLQEMREKTMSTMLADVWDNKLTDPRVITEALREGYLDDTDAKYLRNAIMNPDPPETTNEALIAVRYAIDGIGVTETRESALKKVIAYTGQLSPTDGKSFIKEIFGEHDTKNAFWNREAQDYMEKQIMDVASLTGILYGSGEQLALSAKALMAYDEAKKAAIEEGKPLKGRELLELAHQIMLPFRKQVKPLMSGEKLPETLGGRKVGAGTGAQKLNAGQAAVKAIREIAGEAEIKEFLKSKTKSPTGGDIIGTLEGTPAQKRAIEAVVGKRLSPEQKQTIIKQILNNERIRVKDDAGKIGTIPTEQLADWLAVSGNTLAIE